jgi:hypothetical protein
MVRAISGIFVASSRSSARLAGGALIRQRRAQIGDQPRLIGIGEKLHIQPERRVQPQENRHGQRPDILLDLVEVARAREDQLAWKIAEVAADPVAVDADVTDMIINRIIDNASVAAASVARRPVASARAQAMAHPYKPGATVFGVDSGTTVSPEWAAWANGVAVRELDFHDTYLAADYSHPGDNIPPILAVAQHTGKSGADLIRGLATGYEIQVDLVTGICLHEHKIDHIAHLGPSAAAASARCWACHGGDLSGRPAGAAHHHHHAPVAQGRDFVLEGLCPRLRRQDGDRGRGPRDARRRRAVARLGRRGRLHRLSAVRPLGAATACRCPARARPSARSWTPTPRNIRRNIRARR